MLRVRMRFRIHMGNVMHFVKLASGIANTLLEFWYPSSYIPSLCRLKYTRLVISETVTCLKFQETEAMHVLVNNTRS